MAAHVWPPCKARVGTRFSWQQQVGLQQRILSEIVQWLVTDCCCLASTALQVTHAAHMGNASKKSRAALLDAHLPQSCSLHSCHACHATNICRYK